MPVAESVAPDVDKPPVERAIEAAEGADEPAAAPQPESWDDESDDDVAPAPTPLRAAMGGPAMGAPATARPPVSRPAPVREPIRPMAIKEPTEDAAGSGAIAAIADELRAINQRLDDITSLIERLNASPRSAAPAIGPAWEQAQAQTSSRPAIFRDDGARQPALDPEPEIIDTRPIPAPLPPIQVEQKRGFDLLPRSYRITVEDKRRGVDLVPLHRAMLSMEHVRDMSLLSYNNGIAIVALETTDELNPDELGAQVSRAMSREARVEVHNEHTMVVKLADE
jgi:hypothetical protein